MANSVAWIYFLFILKLWFYFDIWNGMNKSLECCICISIPKSRNSDNTTSTAVGEPGAESLSAIFCSNKLCSILHQSLK